MFGSVPISKLLLDYMPSTLMAGFLYFGAGVGMAIILLIQKASSRPTKEAHLTKKELPFVIAMVALDIAAPICMLLGFIAYGLGIYFYVHAQRILGAARTSAYYAVAPFISVFLSLLIFREIPGILFVAALILMLIGAWLCSKDN